MHAFFTAILRDGIGFDLPVITLTRIMLGTFFLISGAYKLLVPARHAVLIETLKACRIPALGFFQWFVPGVEFSAGGAVALGLFTPLASMGLVCICLVALFTDGGRRVRSFDPIGFADRIEDWEYLTEFWFFWLALFFVGHGAGPISLDAVIKTLA